MPARTTTQATKRTLTKTYDRKIADERRFGQHHGSHKSNFPQIGYRPASP